MPGERAGLACEDCGEIVWISQGLTSVRWLRDRENIVREVEQHSVAGVDTWMQDGLRFMDEHRGHSIVVVTEKP